MVDETSRNPLDNQFQSNDPRFLVSADITLGGLTPQDTTVKEVIVGESLLNPSAHIAVTLQSAIYSNNLKNWDSTKGQTLGLTIKDYQQDTNRQMLINMTIYRCDNRHFSTLNTAQTEELTLHAIDNSILEDARTIMSKSYKCQTPDKIVKDALNKIGVSRSNVENCGPARDYIAESIHPLQVIQQQCNAALASGDDPSFLHYMTFDNSGRNVHNFRSLKNLIGQTAGYKIYASDAAISGGSSFSDGYNIAITYSFPCDFDILSDILNGIGPNGQNLNASKTSNWVNGVFDLIGQATGGNAANIFQAMTNLGTAGKQGTGCESEIEKWLHTRQARMGLLEKDKIALRITVPWSPWLHAGNVFKFVWKNRYDENEIYGSGDYLIVHLTHNIQFGGFATTTLDCIANTLGG